MEFLNKKIYFIGGKGGVGKSTTSSALALVLAKQGKKVLLVSTDPAHNTGDLFHKKLDHGKIANVLPNLDVLEINSEIESNRYINSVKENLAGLVKAEMLGEVHRQIDLAAFSPGSEEAALFDRMTQIILEESPRYQSIVFDTAPTGHTIRLLTLPELMGAWMDGLLERRKKSNENYSNWMNDGEPVEDPLYEKLNERRLRFSKVRELLLSKTATSYLFVINPERLPILETEKALKHLSSNGIEVETIVVNRVIPDQADGSFMAKRRKNEKGYLERISEIFNGKKRIHMPLLDHDISTLADLQDFAEQFEFNIGLVKNS
ncbi:ArsA family ATPase [Mesobacillus harenae]|uniref:ArsA family ATPase n=1 Tax=Mesobacillus harenae TaxID=2213203 RepID=UPI001580AE9F|nr:ArsA family ATPase [Mesobacillus harenae]